MYHPKMFLTVISILLACSIIVVHVHGPLLRIDKKTVAVGDVITVNGEGLSDGSEVHLILQGIFQDFTVGVINATDDHGRFEKQITLSTDLRPGEYTLVASGTETATTRLTITAAEVVVEADAVETIRREKSLTPGESDEGSELVEMGHETANTAVMDLDRSKTGLELGITWGFVFLIAITGFVFSIPNSRSRIP